ncbi:MAG: C40 family peptidase [Phreatobacter sp.]|uniref:C40 family peptidase n=1 Tax=Phreatobacter sp. TaxID=1966341 RepID=UPI001A3E82C5|nr:NlpC/P60 family protein [Phreatobacter sp.]MBL8569360.1 C40 family peptidase [Phreatobacter sp.]
MTAFDRRITPARPDLAAAHLKGQVEAERFVEGRPARVELPILPMAPTRQVNAARDTELLLGEEVQVYDVQGGYAYIQSERDGYVGYVVEPALRPRRAPATHRVWTRHTHVYPGPSIKLPPNFIAPMNARLTIERTSNEFSVTDTGAHVITAHLVPVDNRAADFVAVAELFVGTPYLWAGRTSLGIDCSGLVQTALEAAGVAAPRDSDMQEKALGQPVDLAPDLSGLKRGDLVFWKGHVGIMTSPTELLHANGHHMMVVREPVAEAVARIREKSFGAVTSVKRMSVAAE